MRNRQAFSAYGIIKIRNTPRRGPDNNENVGKLTGTVTCRALPRRHIFCVTLRIDGMQEEIIGRRQTMPRIDLLSTAGSRAILPV